MSALAESSAGTPRTALISGGAHGIGAATAERLAAKGWQVALLDLDRQPPGPRLAGVG